MARVRVAVAALVLTLGAGVWSPQPAAANRPLTAKEPASNVAELARLAADLAEKQPAPEAEMRRLASFAVEHFKGWTASGKVDW
jgi:hypothetical protein